MFSIYNYPFTELMRTLGPPQLDFRLITRHGEPACAGLISFSMPL